MSISIEQLTKLTATDGATGDRFGVSVAIDGDTILSGTYWHDANGSDSGAAYVYERQADGSWSTVKLTSADAAVGDNFGRWVAIDGDTAVVSAPMDDHLGDDDSGSAYVFQRQADGSWLEVAKLTASDASRLDEFGYGITIDGDTIAVGAYRSNTNGRNSGSAYIFQRQADGAWAETAKLTPSDGDKRDFFGHSLALDGDVLVVGADEDENGGSAYIFQRQADGSWSEIAKITANDGAVDDHFGHAVAIDGNRIVVGAYLDDGSGSDTGSAYVFETQADGSWLQTAKLVASDAGPSDRFGRAVAIEGNRILVGSYLDESGTGSTYLYELDANGSWVETAKFSSDDGAPSDNFGRTVALNGDTVVVGAYGDDTETGSAYVYSLNGSGVIDPTSPGEIAFDNDSYVVSEADGIATITLVRSAGNFGSVSVDLVLLDGSAIAPDDYDNTIQTITFLDGETSKTVTVPIVDDTAAEAAETVNLSLANVTGGATLASQSTATLTITANDIPGAIAFDSESYTVAEDGTTASITLVRTGGSAGAVSVDLALTDGSAVAPGDYDNTLQTITFADGETSRVVTIPIVDDGDVEGDETVNLALTNPTGGATLDTLSSAMLTILDNDAPGEIVFDTDSYTVNEDGITASITLVRTGGNAGAVSVDLTLTDGSAVAPGDYDNTLQTITFLDGETSRVVTIPIVDDSEEESAETVNLSLGNATGGATVGSQSTATLTINDNDSPLPAGPIRVEAEAYITTLLPVTTFDTSDASGVSIRGESGNVLTYDAVLPGGTYDLIARVAAPKNLAYSFDVTIGGQTQTVSFGSTQSSWDTHIDIVVPGFTFNESTDPLTVTMTSNRFNLNYLEFVPVGAPPEPVPGAIAFDSESYTVAEDGTTASITLVRTGGSAGAVSVDLALTDGSAVAPGDYDDTLQTITFADGETSRVVTIPIVDDGDVEGDETVNLALTNPTGGATLDTLSSATLTILDNDAPGEIAFDTDSYTVNEDGITASITLVRTGGNVGAASVDLTLTDGSAVAPGDYDNTLQTITFLDGETSRVVTIPIVDDSEEESAETVNLSLRNATGGATVGSQSTATLTINDNDSPLPAGPIRVEAEAYITTLLPVTTFDTSDASGVSIRGESGNVLTYEAVLPGGTYDLIARVAAPKNLAYSFDVTIGGQTQTVSFGSTQSNWDTYIDIVVPGFTFNESTDPLTVTMTSNRFNLNYLEFVPVGAPPEPVPGAIAFDSESYTVAEDGTTASITLVRTGGSAGAVSVDLALTDGSAVAPGDYDDTLQTITFADGETSRVVTIPIVDDGDVEGDETVNLALTNPTGGATLDTLSSATLTIIDNDQVPAPSDVVKIMPLGDSITHGWNTFPGGYRDRLENLLTVNNIAFDFVGTADDNGPATLSDKDHQGHPGWRIDEISAQVDSWLQSEMPDIVQLLIGANDVLQEFDLANAPSRLSALVDQITTALPNAHLIVATIPPHSRTYYNNLALDYNATIEGMVADKVAQGKNVSFVDMYSQMTVADLGDRVHPNQTGYNKMAGVWFDELLDVLSGFGQYEAISDDFYIEAAVTAADDHSTTVSASLFNNSTSDRTDLSFRYFVDLTELLDSGYTTNDVLIGNISGPTVGALTEWDATEDVYYVDVDFGGMTIAAGTSATVDFSLGISTTLAGTAWDETNDWSNQNLTNNASQTRYMPVYDSNGDVLSGAVFA
jgi:lysophospholipase L1-like esterase